MAYSEGDYYNFDMQESYSTSLQPIRGSKKATEQTYTDDKTAFDEAVQNDNTYQELHEAPDLGQRGIHKTNLPTNCKQAPTEVSETSPNKRILVCLTVQFVGVILALGSAAFCIIKIHAQADADGVSNRGIVSTGMENCLKVCHNGGSCRFGFCHCLPGFSGEFCEMEEQDQQKGTGSSSFIRWGRSKCPENVDLAYTGYAAGSRWTQNGSGANYLCLHETPEYDTPVPGTDTSRAIVYGVEYEVSNFPPFASQQNHDMYCAVCRVPKRGAMIMIPARMTCPLGWTREYAGYLMSSRWDHKRTEFICVDRNPEAVQGTHENQDGSVVYPVEVRCLNPDPDLYAGTSFSMEMSYLALFVLNK